MNNTISNGQFFPANQVGVDLGATVRKTSGPTEYISIERAANGYIVRVSNSTDASLSTRVAESFESLVNLLKVIEVGRKIS